MEAVAGLGWENEQVDAFKRQFFQGPPSVQVLQMPWPPSANHYRIPVMMGTRPRLILDSKARRYQSEVSQWLSPAPGGGLGGRLECVLMLWPPTRAKRDVDNFTKGPLDALTKAGIYRDDSQIDVIQVVRRECVKGGRVDVYLWEI